MWNPIFTMFSKNLIDAKSGIMHFKNVLTCFPLCNPNKTGYSVVSFNAVLHAKESKIQKKKKKHIEKQLKFLWNSFEECGKGVLDGMTLGKMSLSFFFNISPWQLHAKLHPSSSSSHPSHLLWDPFCSPSSSGLFPLKISLVSLFFPVLQPHVSSVSTARC